jgi:hypothetical protein
MRIFVLTTNYELRVSRKSHLRDHSNTGTRHGRDNDGAGADYADDDDGGADYADDDDGGADYADDDDGGADYADDDDGGADYAADALTHAELPLDRVTGLSGVKSLQKVDRLTPIKSLKHLRSVMPLKSVQVKTRAKKNKRKEENCLYTSYLKGGLVLTINVPVVHMAWEVMILIRDKSSSRAYPSQWPV